MKKNQLYIDINSPKIGEHILTTRDIDLLIPKVQVISPTINNQWEIIGRGRSGIIYKIPKNDMKNISYTIQDDYIAMKVICPKKEIFQRLEYHNRIYDNILSYIIEFYSRKIIIYKYLLDIVYPNLSDHILRVYDSKYLQNVNKNICNLYLHTEYLENYETLAHFLSKKSNNLKNLVDITLQVLLTVIKLYEYKFYHNDININNIMVKTLPKPVEKKYKCFLSEKNITLKNVNINVKLIDFDLATRTYSRDMNYKKTTDRNTLPYFDLLALFYSVERQLYTKQKLKFFSNEVYLRDKLDILGSVWIPGNIFYYNRTRLFLNNNSNNLAKIKSIKCIFNYLIFLRNILD